MQYGQEMVWTSHPLLSLAGHCLYSLDELSAVEQARFNIHHSSIWPIPGLQMFLKF